MSTPEPEKKSRLRRKGKAKGATAAPKSSEPGRVAQIKQVYDGARAVDPNIGVWMIGTFLVVLLLFVLVGVLVGNTFYLVMLVIFGLMFGTLAAMLVMGKRAEKAAYKQIADQPGATGAALSALKKGWYFEKEPVAADAGRTRNVRDMSHAAMVFRAVGRPGVVLISEGPQGAARRLQESERKKVTRVLGPEVPVHLLRTGKGEGTTPVSELTKVMGKLDKKLTKEEVIAVNKRLRALGGARPPVPPGMDPRKARVDRKAMRGR